MGKVEAFYITLDGNKNYFQSGEYVSGKLVIRATESFNINNVNIEFVGRAKVYWTERRSRGSGKNRRTVTKVYRNNQTYLNFRQILIGIQPGQAEVYLQMGETMFPFNFQLPSNLPTSFRHRVGYIEYYITGHIDIPWAIDKHCQTYFTVIQNVDLNLDPMNRLGSGATDQKVICCGPCASDPIISSITVPKVGYVSGEPIKFQVDIDNKSNKILKECSVSLCTSYIFRATNKNRTEHGVVSTLFAENQINAKDRFIWNGSISIPPVCATMNTRTSSCYIIEISYYLNLYINPSTFSSSHNLIIPINIGTIPLSGGENIPSLPSYENSYNVSSQNNHVYDDDEEDNQTGKNKGEVFQNDKDIYTPIYPMYKIY